MTTSEKKISKTPGSVYAHADRWSDLSTTIAQIKPSSIFVLVDDNTLNHCLPYLRKQLPESLKFEVLEVRSGEEHKNLESCMSVWQSLSDKGADRKSLLINLGGGMVTDLGGFVACTFRRGIKFINIPTTLLAMVDASVGGKTGVDLGVLKNQIGIIRLPEAVIVDPEFLSTLPAEEYRSGMAEVIKHGCISNKEYTFEAFKMNLEEADKQLELIWESILLKDDIITQDPLEHGIRKALNFGHTLGHAIESYRLSSNKPTLLHGEAIAIGMVLELYISARLHGFPEDELNRISQSIVEVYGKEDFAAQEIQEIIKLLIHDKKNSHGQILFVLLADYGKPVLNCIVSDDLILASFEFYSAL